jgi:hypothetical protein
MSRQDLPRRRLTMEIPATLRERMDRLRDATEAASVVEVIRTAIKVYEKVVHAHAAGHRIVERRPNGEETDLMFL